MEFSTPVPALISSDSQPLSCSGGKAGFAARLGRRLAKRLLYLGITLLLGSLAAAMMVRLAPGFDADVAQLDTRLSPESVDALRAKRAANANILGFYTGFIGSAVHGDFGTSLTLQRPVRELLAERWGTTARLAGTGLVGGWLLACFLAFSTALLRHSFPLCGITSALLSSFFLCIPTAVLALAFVLWRGPAGIAIVLVVFPNVFRYARNVLLRSYESAHITTAMAKGLGPLRVFFRHVLTVSAAPLVALAGVSVTIALGATIPIEALLGIPGIGELAWQAALGRDLPVLITVSGIVTFITLGANLIGDMVNTESPAVSS
jgi:peptide/nickel transport system permease protein